jgi:hypothetical protein
MAATGIKIDSPFDAPLEDPYENVLYYNNSESQEDHRRLQTAMAQLQEELGKVKAELTQIYENLNNIEKTLRITTSTNTDFIIPNTASINDIQDLLSLTDPIAKPVDVFDRLDNAADATLQAKLAKELIKLANSYKIPELTFDVQASKRRFNFSTWYSKMQTILSMFPQTALIVQDPNTVTFYPNSNDIGNKALFLLIGAKVDSYFQRAIRHFSGHGDKALAFIKSQCANISTEDKLHFHHAFTTLRIKSATGVLKRFIFAKTEAESAGNSYSEHDLISFALNGLNHSKNPKYDTALQLYRLEREHGKIFFTLEDIEKRFFSMDEQISREKALTRIALGNAANSLKRGKHPSTRNSNLNSKGKFNNKATHASAHVASDSKTKSIICYNCGEEGHIAPKCPHSKQQKRPTAKGCAATSTTNEDDKALVCYARVISSFRNSNEIQQETNNMVRATAFPNVLYDDYAGLSEFLNCNSYTTVWIETYDHFQPQVNSDPKTEVFTHDRPMEEDLIDAAAIFKLNHVDPLSQSC